MAMRTLYELRKLINYLLLEEVIDVDTRIVVEVARDLNDSNKRWAIETYQKRREEENQEFENAIVEMLKDSEISGKLKANPKSDEDIKKIRLWYEQIEYQNHYDKKPKSNSGTNKHPLLFDWKNIRSESIAKIIKEKDLVKKYRLWKEQNCKCLYTGKIINLTDLFCENTIDLEHTLPRSKSFDNSLSNMTVCYADFNRNIKKNRIPFELDMYDEILKRIGHWKKRLDKLYTNIEYWNKKSRVEQDKEKKNNAIRQRHLWKFEYDYWKDKIERFEMKEIKEGFKRSQLDDTQLISKYAFHYLKSVFNKVTVERGTTTAQFRKIYEIDIDGNKNRENHSHHAKDAAVLTLIPLPSRRDEILVKSYKYFEKRKHQYHESPYPSFNSNYVRGITEKILINNIARDKTLITAKKYERKRGKLVYLRDGNGKILKDKKEEKKKKNITGDTIRGQLHKDTYYGAIMEKGEIIFVINTLLADFKKEKDIDGIVDKTVRETISKVVRKRIAEGDTFNEAIVKDIWMVDKNGIQKKNDKNGDKISPIRHVRCKAKAGRGYLRNTLQIKEHSFKSQIEYKQWYYVQNDTNYLYLLYENKTENKLVRTYKIINLFDLITHEIKRVADLYSHPYFSIIESKSKKLFELKAILKVGGKVIMWKESPEEIRDLSKEDLLKRVYRIYKFNSISTTGLLYLQFHSEAREDKELGNDDVIFEPNKYQPRLMLNSNKFNCLIENIDFLLTPDGEIFIND